MKWFKLSLFVLVFVISIPLISNADGLAIGPTCHLLWNPPIINTDGTILTSPITFYKIWVQQAATPIPIPGTTPSTIVLASPVGFVPSWDCSTVGAGQHYAWINAWNGVDSAVSTNSTMVPPVPGVPLAFVLLGIAPGAPLNFRVAP